MTKSADAFRTISEVAEELDLPQHVLRFWETRFPQIKPLKRAGGRRFYRPADVTLLTTIRQLLYGDGYTIKGVQRLLKEQGTRVLQNGSRPFDESPQSVEEEAAIADDALAAACPDLEEREGAGVGAEEYRRSEDMAPLEDIAPFEEMAPLEEMARTEDTAGLDDMVRPDDMAAPDDAADRRLVIDPRPIGSDAIPLFESRAALQAALSLVTECELILRATCDSIETSLPTTPGLQSAKASL